MIAITSPALIGILTGIGPVAGLFCVKNKVVNAFVVPGNAGGGTAGLNLITAIFCVPVDASVGTYTALMVNELGAVNQYPLTLPVKVVACGGKAIVPDGLRLLTL